MEEQFMGLFGEVKCGRCDRRFSAIRSRCPYCGARKRRSGKSSGNGDNRWQVIFGIALLAVIVVAVAVLIFRNISEGGSGKPKTTPTPTVQATSTPRQTSTPTPSSLLPAVTPVPTPQVTSVTLSRQDFTLAKIGETWLLSATITPAGATSNIIWSSQDTKVATVSSDGRVTAVGNGSTTITAEAGGVKATCVVRVTATGSAANPAPSTSSPASGLSLNYTDVTLNATTNESFTLKVSGSSSSPTFSGGSSSVATVDSSGVVRAVAAGTTTVYVTVGGTKLECIVRVVKR
jgi:uncharacterized protein YjdB